MLVVLSVCPKDIQLAGKALAVARKLDSSAPHPCLIAAPRGCDTAELVRSATGYFSAVSEFFYDDPFSDQPWPVPQNWAFQSVARHLSSLKDPTHWFWWEPDAVPLKAKWLDTLEAAYKDGGLPFAGHVVQSMGHMNGVAVYPPKLEYHATRCFLTRSAAFDIVLTEEVGLKRIYNIANLLAHEVKQGRVSVTFASKASAASLIASEAVMFHGCSDGTLHDLMLGVERANLAALAKTVKKSQKFPICFHSGDLGDIIYGLLFARSLGTIDLVLGPDPSVQLREQMNPAKFDWLLPLLIRQPFINSVTYSPFPPPCDYNLNHFRKTWFSPSKKSKCLFQAYAEHFKAPALPEDCAWMQAEPLPTRPVVVNRTPRYRNPTFPWKTVATRYASRIAFVGTEGEYAEWQQELGNTADYYKVTDALHLARIVAGAKLFIGNQSFPMSLALAMGVPIIQETSNRTADCVFDRPNAQYSIPGPIKWPDLVDPDIRIVSTEPNADGWHEFGPQIEATGLGDILTLTPLAANLKRALLCLPPSLAHYATLFTDICPVQFTGNPPWFRHVGGVNMAASKLKFFGLEKASPLPVVRITDTEKVEAQMSLEGIERPLVFVPSCSKTWAHVRERPAGFWEPIVKKFSERFTVLQFGRSDYPLVPGAKRMPYLEIRKLAAIYSVTGNYLGVDTGDYHLAVAVGCYCIVLRPEEQEGYCRREWEYQSPRISYLPFDQKAVLNAYAKALASKRS